MFRRKEHFVFVVCLACVIWIIGGCDFLQSEAAEGGGCYGEGKVSCDGNNILKCDNEVWAPNGQCKLSESCMTESVTDEYGESTSRAFCVESNGAGGYCGETADKWQQRCVGQEILRCDGYRWEFNGTCKTEQTCSENQVLDEYGEGTYSVFCVEPNGAGAYCGDSADKWEEKCVGQEILRCDGYRWEYNGTCEQGQQCHVESVTDEYGEVSKDAKCQ